MIKNAFWDGFEKRALQDTRLKEDLAVAGTSLLPFGTTIHTLAKDPKGGDSGVEWAGRMAGGIGGALLGGAIGKRPGAYLGSMLGEVGASRLVHQGKYDKKGKLLPKYKGKD